MGLPFNSCNDICQSKGGVLFFTDPRYGLSPPS